MSDILVTGVGPLPVQDAQRLYAPGLRTWSFARHLAAQGHQVICATANFGGIEDTAPLTEPLSVGSGEVRFQHLPLDLSRIVPELRRLAAQHQLSGAVSTTDIMNRALAQAHLAAPLWLDFNGHPMAERQLQAAVHRNDGGLQAQWDYVLPSLLFGDRFSTCSTPQKYALCGELGTVGRLNQQTASLDLIASIPPAVSGRQFEAKKTVMRDSLCRPEDFVLLWTGGYNTWTDVDTLFQGLELAMERHPRLVYVSTGGSIDGHDEFTFPRFKALVENSPHRARYHFVGWVDNEDMGAYYREADAAINLDRWSYDALFGFRNRVTEWMMAGLPVLTTPASELTMRLVEEELVEPITVGNPESLAQAVGRSIDNREAARSRAEIARKWLKQQYDPDLLLRPLVEWCAAPQAAPDLPPPAERPRLRWIGPENSLAKSHYQYMKKAKLL
jgi:glycosyltransferase involved in cell wall biosynthesis